MRKFLSFRNPRNFTAEEVKNALIVISKTNQYETLINNNKELFAEVLFELKRNHLDTFSIINTWLKEELTSPPLELLWILEKENLLHFTTYLYFHQDYSPTIQCCISNVLSGDLEENEKISVQFILTGILNILLAIRNGSDFKYLSEDILHSTVSEALKLIDSTSLIHWNYLSDLKKLSDIHLESIQEFALFHLTKLLTYEGSSFEITFVVSNHTKQWINEKLTQELKDFISEIITTLDSKVVLNEINNVVQQQTFNWKYLLVIISLFVELPRNSELLKGAVDGWLKNALEDKDKSLLFLVLIIARHCCAEKARYFTNYPTWFGSVPLKSVSSFTFFFECLSQLVPNEPPLFLKIHVNKVPSAPPSCQSLIIDYIDLAKTRLSDLNETTDYIGLFNDYHETDEEGQESDVTRAISLFEENNEIPKPLIEASVFRRQYYEKTFLKRLLSVSETDDPSRALLIKKLYSAGKVPSAMYRSWSSLSLLIK